ncbi:MAG TPA: hypothetical protein VJK08_01260 [Patescibacteria group bacterium]|nr:hypothetical protein [Patescibacteria group bacterium]
MLLYLETISDLTKIIIYTDDLEELNRKEWQTNRNQTEELLTQLDNLVQGRKNQIHGIFVNTNTGSYTSMRIGLTAANFLGVALNIQPVGVSSFESIKFKHQKKFTTPLLPTYQNRPFITKKKE